ncbi:hypothetical protein BHE74_00051513 [Ensete ventricosum]|nr:hypothetical protein BHE74_00051513 [Ensete ventricosum]
MTSSDSSSSVRVDSPQGSGETSRSDPEVGSSGASSGPPSLVDARVLRDLEVMMSDHDLDTMVTEGSLAVIRERYSIPAEYGLHVPQPGQRPYNLDVPDICISVDALECRGAGIIPTRDLFMACFCHCKSRGGYYLTARVDFRVSGAPSSNKGWKSRYLYVSGPIWGFRLDWSAHPMGNAPPYLSEEETVLVGRLKGILSSSRAIKEMAELWLVEAGLSPASRDRMNLGELRGMPKVAGGKVPPTRPIACEVGASPAREAPRASSKRPVAPSPEQAEDAGRHHKKNKSADKEAQVSSRRGGLVPATRSQHFQMALVDRVHDVGRLITFMDYRVKQRQEELNALKSRGGSEAVAEAEERVSWLREELEKIKGEKAEELLRREASEKELQAVRGHLGDAQKLLKEARTRARRMDDELLQAVKDLENTRAELPGQSVARYKGSLGFKEGLKRMG